MTCSCHIVWALALVWAGGSAYAGESTVFHLDKCGRESEITITHAHQSRDGVRADVSIENFEIADQQFDIVIVPRTDVELTAVAKFAVETADVTCLILDRWAGEFRYLDSNVSSDSHRFQASCGGIRDDDSGVECEGFG